MILESSLSAEPVEPLFPLVEILLCVQLKFVQHYFWPVHVVEKEQVEWAKDLLCDGVKTMMLSLGQEKLPRQKKLLENIQNWHKKNMFPLTEKFQEKTTLRLQKKAMFWFCQFHMKT